MKHARMSLAWRITTTLALVYLLVHVVDLGGSMLRFGLPGWLVVVVLTALLAIITALMLALQVSSPLERITEVIERAAAGDSLERLPLRGPQELQRLSDATNRLLERITSLEASKIESDVELGVAQYELELKSQLEEKNRLIEKANTDLERRIDQLQLLFDLASALGKTLQAEKVVENLLELVGDRLDVEGFLLVLRDEKGRLDIKAATGAFEESAESMDPHRGILTRSMRLRKPVTIGDLSKEQVDQNVCRVAPMRGSLLSVPLLHRREPLGFMAFWRSAKEAFGPVEEQLMVSVAQLVSMALVNARLYEEKLALSVTDELTKVANRRLLKARLEMECDRSRRYHQPLSLLMLDIDHFKKYNDRNGHMLGDEVLRQVAEILRNNTRSVDTVARFGGEEFVVILPGQDKASSAQVAEKLRQAIEKHPFPREHTQPGGKVTASLGVAEFPADADTPDALLEAADLALYASKHAGRNRTTVYHVNLREMEQERQRQLEAKRQRRKRRKFHPRRMEIVDPT